MCPVNRKFDILINQKGYMLSRATKLQGRAWQRSGQPDTPDKRPRAVEEVGVLPPQIEYPELWNDWSGGFGYPYRQPKDTQSFYGFYENPNRFHWAENMDTRFPHQLVHCQQMRLLDPTSYPSLSINVINLIDVPVPSINSQNAGVGGIFVITAGSPTGTAGRLYPTGLATNGSAFDTRNYGPVNSGPGRPAIHGSYIEVSSSMDSSYFPVYPLDDAAYAQTNTLPGNGFTTAGNRLWRYWGPVNGRRIFFNSAAVTYPAVMSGGNWSFTLSLGNQQAQINDMRAYKDQVFIGAENGLYVGDQSGTFINVLEDLAGHADADNCRDLAIHNGQVVAQHVAGIYAYNPTITTTGQVREIGPNLLNNRSPVSGKIRALEAFGPWLYAGLWTGSQSYMLAGIDDNAPGPYSWHVMQRYPHIARPQRIYVDGVTSSSGGLNVLPQRMWAATDPSVMMVTNVIGTFMAIGTAPLYYWPIPLLNGDPLSQQMGWSANYVGSARIDLGIVDSRAPATPKLYRSVTIESENLASPYLYCDVYYTIDQGTRTLLGRAIDSPRSTLYFGSTPGNFAHGFAIELSLQSFTATQSISPVYRSIIMRSTFRPDSVDVITAVIDVADGTRDREGASMRPGGTQLTELRALSRSSLGVPAAVALIDLAGATSVVEVLAPVEEMEVYQAGNDNPQVAATVKMAVMTFTTTYLQ